jgi:hypothetical protein
MTAEVVLLWLTSIILCWCSWAYEQSFSACGQNAGALREMSYDQRGRQVSTVTTVGNITDARRSEYLSTMQFWLTMRLNRFSR